MATPRSVPRAARMRRSTLLRRICLNMRVCGCLSSGREGARGGRAPSIRYLMEVVRRYCSEPFTIGTKPSTFDAVAV
ncbi:hypothetical protein GCM10010213_31040 [Microbacterium maritypicum]|uniref:Uncharacterized protein n=1 Tax=Microbacterium maritypicum TaxID=33918 RepID=A0A4Y4BCI7_MICMQ|nr:hypothetical protein MLI01_30350 [Microbacterium liquefaciens]GGV65268.1 hypothetical protein GCM10010213_31040 [Microbacterium liquefaciens]